MRPIFTRSVVVRALGPPASLAVVMPLIAISGMTTARLASTPLRTLALERGAGRGQWAVNQEIPWRGDAA